MLRAWEVNGMDDFWELFCQTGAPEAYMLYRAAQEENACSKQKTVTSGLVLRQTVTKETDLILTVLTPDLGKIPVIARGARRKTAVWPPRASCWPTPS